MFAFRSSEKKASLTRYFLKQWLYPSILVAALLAMCSWGVAVGQVPSSPDQPGLLPKFYDVPDDTVAGTPGSIINLTDEAVQRNQGFGSLDKSAERKDPEVDIHQPDDLKQLPAAPEADVGSGARPVFTKSCE